jgi:hypothetical protein
MQRFFDKIEKTETCWIWKGALRGKSSYGAIKYKGKVVDTHRVSYELHKGEIPKGLLVCHTCDVRKCVNPEHLFLGTHSDNSIDAYQKGRVIVPTTGSFKKGCNSFNALLKNAEEITNLKNIVKNRTITLKKLAEQLNLPYQLLRDISSGRVYKKF